MSTPSDATGHGDASQPTTGLRWCERSVADLLEALAEVESGRTKSLDEFDCEFRARHQIGDPADQEAATEF
ncbi:hypothetical protein [Planctellipticum variicoloris]|uniref:hypothetical protein n=1 Tax=Planctellipticum variicoloris TaxID=3064265 RepID=UPI0030132081|nr:hypothetical protein SH412_004248 [Planctomycetaceae bacterium SH412]